MAMTLPKNPNTDYLLPTTNFKAIAAAVVSPATAAALALSVGGYLALQ